MSAVLLAACLVSSISPGGDVISVHEWGVVLYSSGATTALGMPASSPYGEITVDAPVLYFHGPAFTGDVTVCSLGRIFAAYPEPDVAGGPMTDLGGRGLGSMIRWSGLSISPQPSDDMPAGDDRSDILPRFGWAMSLWRAPEASWIAREKDSFQDGFLYYEVDLSEVGFPVPLDGFCAADAPDDERVTGDLLVFHRLDDGTVACTLESADGLLFSDESVPSPSADRSCEAAFDSVRQWADPFLTEAETRAMWATWEPYILYGDWQGRSLAVFPLPQPLVERISAIIVTPGSGEEVTQCRFFLGMLAI